MRYRQHPHIMMGGHRNSKRSMAPFVPEGFKDKYENYQAVLADGWEFTDDGFWIKCT